MKRGISPVIAIVVLMLMTVSAAGMAYLTITTYQSEAAGSTEGAIERLATVGQSQIKVESIGDGKLYLRSIGENCESVIVQVGSEPAQVLGNCEQSLEAFDISSECESGYQTVKITSGGQTITQRVQCSELVGAPVEEEVCEVQTNILSSQYASLTEPPWMAFSITNSDLLGHSFSLPSGHHVSSVDLRLNNTIDPTEVRVYVTNTDPTIVAPWSLFSAPNGTAVAQPGDTFINVPVNDSGLSAGTIYVLAGSNATGSELSMLIRSESETVYACGPSFGGGGGIPTDCNQPMAESQALADTWVNTANCDCGDGEIDAGEDCSTCWEDAKCPEGEGCVSGVCTTCDSGATSCDGVCTGGRGCYGYDLDCDQLGNPALACCGNMVCESGEDSGNCPDDCPYQTYSFSDGSVSKRLTFSGAGSDNSAKIKVPQNADIQYATVDIAGATNNFDTYIKEKKSLNVTNRVYDVHVSGNYAYLAAYDSPDALIIVDVTDPLNPVKVGNSSFGWQFRSVQVVDEGSEQSAFVGSGGSSDKEFIVFNVTNKTSPEEISSLNLDGTAYGYELHVVSDYAYIAAGDAGLRIVNVSNKTNLTEVGNVSNGMSARGVHVVGDYAYVGDSLKGFSVVNVTNKSNPVNISSIEYSNPGDPGVYSDGNYAYVCGGSNFRIIDVSDPINPSIIGYSNKAGCLDIQLSGNYAYLVGDSYAMAVFDISDKTDPKILFTLQETSPDIHNSVSISGNYAFLGNENDQLHVVDISQTGSILKENYDEVDYYAADLNVVNDYAYVADYDEGLSIFDMSDKSNPVKISGIDVAVALDSSISVQSNYAYLSSGFIFNIIDVSDVNNPSLIRNLTLNNSSDNLFVRGDLAYITSGQSGGGFEIVNISDKQNPSSISHEITSGNDYDIFVDNTENWAYVVKRWASENSTLQIFDVSDKTNPVPRGEVNMTGEAGYVKASGNYAYVGAEGYPGSGLHVFDVSDKDNPSEVGTGDALRGSALYDIHVNGDYVYGVSAGLEVFNVSDPANPMRLATYWEEGLHSLERLHFDGTNAYLAGKPWGVIAFDVSDPENPTRLTDKMGVVHSLAVKNDYLITSGDRLGVFDISTRDNPVKQSVETFYARRDIKVAGDYAYTSTSSPDWYSNSLGVFDLSNPTSPTLAGLNIHEQATNRLFVSGNTVFAACQEGFYYFDVTNKENPKQIGVNTPTGDEEPEDVFVEGELAYRTDHGGSDYGLRIVNITTQSVVGENTTYDVDRVYVQDGYAYSGGNTLKIYDVSDPTSPFIVNEGDIWLGSNSKFYVAGDLLYTLNWDFVEVYNVSNKVSPELVKKIYYPASSVNEGYDYFISQVAGDYIYVSQGTEGFVVMRIGDSEYPQSPSVDAGNDDQNTFSISGEDYSSQVVDITNDLESVISSCTCTGCTDDGQGNCIVDLNLEVTGGSGEIIVHNPYVAYKIS